jgi:hypothetical protein
MDRYPANPVSDPGGILRLSGTLNLFGFPPEAAVIEVIPRSRAWRGRRAGAYFATGLILTPIRGSVPPHAPWALGALAFGGFFGLRKWRELFTMDSLTGLCPKCGGAMRVKTGTPFRNHLSVPCEACHHDARLEVTVPKDLGGPGGAVQGQPDATLGSDQRPLEEPTL